MPADASPTARVFERRRSTRALVCASVELFAKGECTEHMTCDLSVGGARLCGIPAGQPGDKVELLLQLPGSSVRASGRLTRIDVTGVSRAQGSETHFAVEFMQLNASAEEAIRTAVIDALRHPQRRSILLIQEPGVATPRAEWLEPVSSICAPATTPLGAVRHLSQNRILFGLIAGESSRNLAWPDVFPSTSWRAVDSMGRLHSDLGSILIRH